MYKITQSTQYAFNTLEIHCVDLMNLLTSLYCSYYCIIWRTETAMVAPKISNCPLLSTLCTQFRYLLGTYYPIFGNLDINCSQRYFCRKSDVCVGRRPFFYQTLMASQLDLVQWSGSLILGCRTIQWSGPQHQGKAPFNYRYKIFACGPQMRWFWSFFFQKNLDILFRLG